MREVQALLAQTVHLVLQALQELQVQVEEMEQWVFLVYKVHKVMREVQALLDEMVQQELRVLQEHRVVPAVTVQWGFQAQSAVVEPLVPLARQAPLA